MKKIWLIPVAIVISLLCIIGVDWYSKARIDENIEKATYYNNIFSRNCSDYTMGKIIDENSVIVLGSSELGASDNLAYPPSLFNSGYSDFNMVLMGAGYLQSVPQAVNLGALHNNVKNGKIVLILSPQWFNSAGLTSDEYCSRFEETNFIEFLKNDDISKETKIAISNRINELLTSDPTTLARVQKDEEVYLYHSLNPFIYAEMITYNCFRDAKMRFQIAEELDSLENNIDYANYVNVDTIDWKDLVAKAEVMGAEECTTNKFGVNDDYYNTYIKDGYEAYKGSYAGESYTSSPEFSDLRLFLDVCKETGIEPLIISVPVNGRWYDYCEFSKADRNTYYQMVRDICAEYDVKLADFSDKEYELYFLRDIMHMGWKGWAYLDRSVYNFYNDDEIVDTTTYEKLVPIDIKKSDGINAVPDGYTFSTTVDGNAFNSIVVSLPYDNTLIDSTSSTEHRSGTFLQTAETGEYAIKVSANSNLQDEYVEYNFYLEKDSVYKLEYDVESLDSTSAFVKDFTFSKITY